MRKKYDSKKLQKMHALYMLGETTIITKLKKLHDLYMNSKTKNHRKNHEATTITTQKKGNV